jgi:hypothetical protein
MIARIAILIGSLLVAVTGATILVNQGFKSPSVFIPAGLGLVLTILGVVGLNEGMRKHAMHAAVLVALLGGLGCLGMGFRMLSQLGTDNVPTADRFGSVFSTALLCLAFVVLCVRSFIQARRQAAA